MDPTQTTSDAAAELAGWIVASMPWLGAALLLAVCAGVVGIWQLVRRTHDLERAASRLDAVDDIKVAVQRLASERSDLDLRRIEHALLEIRDGQRRLEDRLLQVLEAAGSGSAAGGPTTTAAGLSDRVTNRLLVQGYERVQVVTPLAELPAGEGAEGDVLVEAHRNGVLYKGRVQVRGGVLLEVELKPAYSAFP